MKRKIKSLKRKHSKLSKTTIQLVQCNRVLIECVENEEQSEEEDEEEHEEESGDEYEEESEEEGEEESKEENVDGMYDES